MESHSVKLHLFLMVAVSVSKVSAVVVVLLCGADAFATLYQHTTVEDSSAVSRTTIYYYLR
jgi:hypothetical protein